MVPMEKDYVSMLKLATSLDDSRFYDILHMFMDNVMVPSLFSLPCLQAWFSAHEHLVGTAVPTAKGELRVCSLEDSQTSLDSIITNRQTGVKGIRNQKTTAIFPVGLTTRP